MRKARSVTSVIEQEAFAEDNLEPALVAGSQFVKLKRPHPEAAKLGPYEFPEKQLQDLAVAIRLRLNVMLTGPTGCGKTSLPMSLAALLGRPVVRFNMNGETRVTSLVGMQKPVSENGALGLKFAYGALVRAMRHGYWVVLDELDAALPSVLMVLQPVLEEGSATIYVPETDEHVHAHPEFRLFATGNTVGYRALSRAKHAGTNPLNTALLDRFGMVIACDYPDKSDEVRRIRAHVPDCDLPCVVGIVRVAHELRSDSKFRSDLSTRRLIQWARLSHAYAYDILRSLDLAVLRKFENPTDAKITREVACRVFGYDNTP